MISPHRVGRELVLWSGGVLGTLCLAGFLAGWLLHVTPLVFVSGSMSPTYEAGALGVAREVPADRLEVGDVVSVINAAGDRVTHRIVSTTPSAAGAALTLKGDTNHIPDAETYDVAAADRVAFGVPYAGYVLDAATTPFGLLLMALLAFGSVALGFGRRDGDAPRHGRTRLLLPAGVASLVALGGAIGVSGGAPWAFTSAVWSDSATATSSIGAVATDTTPPVLSNPVPGDNATASSWLGLDCSNSGAGVEQICVTATDAGGAGVSSVAVKLVRTSGTQQCWNGTTFVNGTACSSQSMTVLSGSQYRTSGLTSALMPLGTYTATFTASDAAGNPASSLAVTFAVMSAPTITGCADSGGNSVNISWTWAESNPSTGFEVRSNKVGDTSRSFGPTVRSNVSNNANYNNFNAEVWVVAVSGSLVSPQSAHYTITGTGNGGKTCTLVP